MDSLNDALIDAVRALGGSKQVGPLLWPEKAPEAAQRLILACLNEDRPERLSPEQFLMILRLCQKKGFHAAFSFISADLGYSRPVPLEPKDESAELMRQVIESQKLLSKQMERLASLQPHLRMAA